MEPHLSEEKYGDISPVRAVWPVFKTLIGLFLMTLKRLAYIYCYSGGGIFRHVNESWLRAWLWRRIGAHVGKNVHIYRRVALDYSTARKLFIEDNVSIAEGCTLLLHMRKFDEYCHVGDFYRDLPYIQAEIHLKRGCFIGTNAMIMPGVTVGEGAIVGASSFVVRDVPPWTFVAGNPAREIKTLLPREEEAKA